MAHTHTRESNERMLALALRLIDEGTAYRGAHVVEGDGESGPYSLPFRGFRLGQLKLERQANGQTFIIVDKPVDDVWGYPTVWFPVPSAHTKHHADFRWRRVHRALGVSDIVNVKKATRAQRKASGRRLTPDHQIEYVR